MILKKGKEYFLFQNGRSKHLGELITPGEFYTVRNRKKHFLYKYAGWGLNKKLIDYLEKEHVAWVVIRVEEDNKLIRVPLIQFKKLGHFFQALGYEEQIIMPEVYFEEAKPY